MDRLTQKERAQLEDVFAAIYANKQSKFRNFYNAFFKRFQSGSEKFKTRVVLKISHIKRLNLKRK